MGLNLIPGVPGFQTVPFEQRFWGKVERADAEGCWLWTGALNACGYGIFTVAGSTRLAHRVAYERSRGLIPQGLVLDHLCRNRNCVNPKHLEPVTQRENVLRGDYAASARKMRAATHCKRGHEFNEQNTYWSSLGRRSCRSCGTEQWRAKHRPTLCGTPVRKWVRRVPA